jgi:hypothetical protein
VDHNGVSLQHEEHGTFSSSVRTPWLAGVQLSKRITTYPLHIALQAPVMQTIKVLKDACQSEAELYELEKALTETE